MPKLLLLFFFFFQGTGELLLGSSGSLAHLLGQPNFARGFEFISVNWSVPQLDKYDIVSTAVAWLIIFSSWCYWYCCLLVRMMAFLKMTWLCQLQGNLYISVKSSPVLALYGFACLEHIYLWLLTLFMASLLFSFSSTFSFLPPLCWGEVWLSQINESLKNGVRAWSSQGVFAVC